MFSHSVANPPKYQFHCEITFSLDCVCGSTPLLTYVSVYGALGAGESSLAVFRG